MAIHRVFEETVRLRPDTIALIEGDRVSRMAELNARANRHAHRLLALGVQPGTPVAIVASRSIDTVTAVLGVLKAGAAWVPVDPAYPAERIAFMLQDCKAPVIMTTAGHAATLAEPAATVIAIDDDAALGGYPDHDPGVADAVDAVAYIVYTSGSTGNPKGVLGTHRGAVNRFAWMWRAYPFTASDVCCHKTALSFVDSIWEIFGPLLQAVPNVIIDDATMREPSRLIDQLAAHRVTRIVLVPSLLRAMMAVPALADRLPALRVLGQQRRGAERRARRRIRP